MGCKTANFEHVISQVTCCSQRTIYDVILIMKEGVFSIYLVTKENNMKYAFVLGLVKLVYANLKQFIEWNGVHALYLAIYLMMRAHRKLNMKRLAVKII